MYIFLCCKDQETSLSLQTAAKKQLRTPPSDTATPPTNTRRTSRRMSTIVVRQEPVKAPVGDARYECEAPARLADISGDQRGPVAPCARRASLINGIYTVPKPSVLNNMVFRKPEPSEEAEREMQLPLNEETAKQANMSEDQQKSFQRSSSEEIKVPKKTNNLERRKSQSVEKIKKGKKKSSGKLFSRRTSTTNNTM